VTTDELSDPVYDIDAERYTLACMMLHPSAALEAAELLEPGSFFRPAHRVVFHALIAMAAAGEKTDPVTLRAWLEQDGDMRVLGPDGYVYLAELSGIPVVAMQVATYAKVVLRLAVRRTMIEVGTRMIQRARLGDASEVELVESGHALLDGVLTGGAGTVAAMPVLTADEFCDADDINAEPLIPGLLYRMERVIAVGPEGAGKSILGLQMAFTSAAGVHPFDHGRQIEPVMVLVVDLENPPHLVQRRFRTFRRIAEGHPGWDGKSVQLLHKPAGLNLTSSRDAYGLAQVIKASGAQLVVAGPIYKMLSGVEANLDTYAQVAAFWDRMREDHDIALWLEAHAPYGQGARRIMRPEGSNLWAKWCEYGIALNWATKKHGGAAGLDWAWFKGQREEGRGWPSWITRNRLPGSGWPWLANYEQGALDIPLPDAR
jgi:hypothetical protein